VPWGQRLGGAEVMLQSLLEGGHEHEHELELVFFQAGPWPDELAAGGLRVEVIPAGRMREAHLAVASVVKLARLLHRRQPDLILNWSPKTHLYGSVAAVLAGVADRVTWWQHSIPLPPAWIDRAATLLPAVAVGCCSRAAAEAQKRILPSRPTFVVAPGAPGPVLDGGQAARDRRHEVPVMGMVGRLQPWKGQDRLLRAQAILRDRGHLARTMIVGGDAYDLSPDYAASLPALISDLGLDEAVTLTGHVPDVGRYIEQMDILVNASDPEPFGIVLLEAMARGVAVVAVDAGGPAEFIEDRRTGMLARSGEPAALADALEPLITSESLRRDLARAGHERFTQRFTDAAMRERFFQALELVCSGRDGSSPRAGMLTETRVKDR
jgi:glycosyltransferase involved in cell wall biosynthesis